jgi:hypothetical protein
MLDRFVAVKKRYLALRLEGKNGWSRSYPRPAIVSIELDVIHHHAQAHS